MLLGGQEVTCLGKTPLETNGEEPTPHTATAQRSSVTVVSLDVVLNFKNVTC